MHRSYHYWSALLVSLGLWPGAVMVVVVQAQADVLTPLEFQDRVATGDYDVIVDVRRKADEFDLGHIPGATLVESLNLFGQGGQIGTPSDLAGCEFCEIIVYCRTGVRARTAITLLRANDFQGRLWSGQGTTQWLGPLVTTPSVVPPCTVNQTVSDECYNEFLSYSNATTNTTDDGGEEVVTSAPTMSDAGTTGTSTSWLTLLGVFAICLSYLQ
jgi:rhodanese-related sulfurtransferase